MSTPEETIATIRSMLETAESPEDKRAIVPMAYNLAADTWQGWDDIDHVPESDRKIGEEAARINIALAAELEFGPERRKNGYWVLGAHLIQSGDLAGAMEAFTASLGFANEASDEAAAKMTEGWLLVCRILGGENLTSELAEVEGQLQSMGEGGTFYASQFGPALEAFG